MLWKIFSKSLVTINRYKEYNADESTNKPKIWKENQWLMSNEVEITLPDGEVISVPHDEARSGGPLGAILGKIKKERIAVEFECGECCKKVINGASINIISGFLFLAPPLGECLFLKLFSAGKLAEKQILKFIIIPFDKVCSIEFGAIEIDP